MPWTPSTPHAHPPSQSPALRRRKKRRKQCRPEGRHCLRGLNVVGSGAEYCQPHMEPKTGTRWWRRQMPGPPDTQHDGKWHVQRRPLGRRCMRDLDVCWSWGPIIYYWKSDENRKINTPPPPIHVPGWMDPQPSGVRAVAREPRWPPLEKATIRPGNWTTRCPGTPSLSSISQTAGNASRAPPNAGAMLAPAQNNE